MRDLAYCRAFVPLVAQEFLKGRFGHRDLFSLVTGFNGKLGCVLTGPPTDDDFRTRDLDMIFIPRGLDGVNAFLADFLPGSKARFHFDLKAAPGLTLGRATALRPGHSVKGCRLARGLGPAETRPPVQWTQGLRRREAETSSPEVTRPPAPRPQALRRRGPEASGPRDQSPRRRGAETSGPKDSRPPLPRDQDLPPSGAKTSEPDGARTRATGRGLERTRRGRPRPGPKSWETGSASGRSKTAPPGPGLV